MLKIATRPQSTLGDRSGFTLVEILVSLVIASIITSMLSVAIIGANRQARQIRSRSLIQRLNVLVLQIYEQQADRSVAAPVGRLQSLPANRPLNGLAAKSRSLSILNWKRDFLRCELPDQRQDVIDPPINIYYRRLFDEGSPNQLTTTIDSNPIIETGAVSVPAWGPAQYSTTPRWASQSKYRNRVLQMVQVSDPPSAPTDFSQCFDGNPNNGEWTRQYESAECLYLILATHIVNGVPAIDVLKDRDVGDLDEDGVPEVLDPNGTPLGFLRWPCGYYLPLEWEPDSTATPTIPNNAVLAQRNVQLGKDPLDILISDPRYDQTDASILPNYEFDDPIPLVPLIVSAGNDGWFDITPLDDQLTEYDPLTDRPAPYQYAITPFPILPSNTLGFPGTPPFFLIDPYQYSVPIRQRFGAPNDYVDSSGEAEPEIDNTADNIYPSIQ